MKNEEQAIVFDCAGEALVGVFSVPEDCADTGIVIVVGGPQYRAGSHRQFVLLARRLADGGFPVLRFDYRGMGDSSGDKQAFDAVSLDIAAAIDTLSSRVPRVTRVVLWGLCDGASAALLYLQETSDPRVAGLCLANPWVRSESSMARAHLKHYYRQRVLQRSFWTKLLGGGVGLRALRGLLRDVSRSRSPSPAASAFQERMADAWQSFEGTILLLLSEEDHTAKEFLEYMKMSPRWVHALDRAAVERRDIQIADHTFSDHRIRGQVEECTCEWLQRHFPHIPPFEGVTLSTTSTTVLVHG